MVTMEQEHSKVALCKQAFFGLSGHGFCCGRRLIKCGRVTRQEARQEGNSHGEEADYLHHRGSYFTQPEAERNKARR